MEETNMAVKPVPEGYQSVIPYLTVKGAGKIIEFLKKALDAKLDFPPMLSPDGKIMHAQLRVGDSVIMVGEARDKSAITSSMFYMYVPNTDELYNKALKAGGTSISPPTNQFYGDRSAAVTDPCGNQWYFATHVEDLSDEEMKKRMAALKK
jgi:PhnB protein